MTVLSLSSVFCGKVKRNLVYSYIPIYGGPTANVDRMELEQDSGSRQVVSMMTLTIVHVHV